MGAIRTTHARRILIRVTQGRHVGKECSLILKFPVLILSSSNPTSVREYYFLFGSLAYSICLSGTAR